MEMNEYQKLATRTAQFDEKVLHPLAGVTLGLTGETGEIAEKVKKLFRNDKGLVSDEKREDLKKELGDVLWYLSQFARLIDVSLEDVATANIKKLESRLERGVIKSEGDNR